MAKYNVKVKLKGSVNLLVNADTETKAKDEAILKFINEVLNTDTVAQYVDECFAEAVEEVFGEWIF